MYIVKQKKVNKKNVQKQSDKCFYVVLYCFKSENL